MWYTHVLSRLRQTSRSMTRVASDDATARSADKHVGPMSDRQLAVAIRKFQQSVGDPACQAKKGSEPR